MKKLKLAIIFLLVTVCSLSQVLTGKVLYVSNGDTLIMSVSGRKEKIRFYGIDAPEKAQPSGLEAKEFVFSKIRDKIIKVEVIDIDRYNRKIGKIYYDNGKYLNEEIINNGHAWWYQQYAKNDTDLKVAEEYAKSQKLGLWQGSSIIAPWDWRRGKRKAIKDPALVEGAGNLVYVTKTGKKYHREGCRYLKSIAASYKVEEAESRRDKACSKFR